MGRLIGWDANLPDAAQVELSRSGWKSMKSQARLDGTFEIDISELLETRSPAQPVTSPTSVAAEPEIEIWVRHRSYLPARELIASEVIASSRSASERIEIRRDIQLHRAACVTGRARKEDTSHFEGVQVHLLPPGEQSFSTFKEVSSSTTDAEGRYLLRAPESGEYLVLARRRGWSWVAVRVLLTRGASLELPDLVLEQGPGIQGRVEIPMDWVEQVGSVWQHIGLHGLEIHARPWNREATERSDAGVAKAVISEANQHLFPELRGGWEYRNQVVQAELGGGFLFAGLGAGEWELSVHGIRSSALLQMRQPTVVGAPATEVVLGRHLCRLTAIVTEGGRRVNEAEIAWRATANLPQQRVSKTRTDDGQVIVIGDVSMDYSAAVSHAGLEEVLVQIPAAGRPKDHTIMIALPPGIPSAALLLRIPSSAHTYPNILVHLSPANSSDPTTHRSHQRIDKRCELRDGAYPVIDVLPGKYLIEVGPSDERGPVAFYGGFLMTERFELEFLPGIQEERTLAMRTGGRLRIDVEGFAGGEHLVPFELLDAHGLGVTGPNVVAEFGDGRGGFSAREGVLSLKNSNAFQPCLAPGIYELRLKDSAYDADPVSVEVRALETTTAKLRVRKR